MFSDIILVKKPVKQKPKTQGKKEQQITWLLASLCVRRTTSCDAGMLELTVTDGP
jgi:hypothetical protein